MTPQQLILHLKNATAQAPMSLTDIALHSGVPAAEAKFLLDSMFDRFPSLVNRAEIMRKGEWQWYYWPTGSVEKAQCQHIVINPKKAQFQGVTLHQLRRNQNQLQAEPALTEKEAAMKKAQKYNTIDLIKTVINSPGITSIQLKDKLAGTDSLARMNVNSMINKSFTQKLLKLSNGKGSALILGDNEQWLAQNDLLPELTPNTESSKKNQSAITETITDLKIIAKEIETVLVEPAEAQVIRQPTLSVIHNEAFERLTEATRGIGDDETVDQQLEDEIPAFLRKEPDTEKSKVRYAITSDLTLLIFGVNDEPIELSTDETELLDSFLNNSFVSTGRDVEAMQ